MCGIIGILGKKPAAPLLIDGLKRLAYRGYDSAGVATLVNGHIDRRRAEGKKEAGPAWPMWKKAAVAAGAIAVLGVGTAALMHKSPCPECADQMLTDIFGPGLKK